MARRGNSHQDNYNLRSRTLWTYHEQRHVLDLAYGYEGSDGESVVDDFKADYQFDWMLDGRWLVSTTADYYQNDFHDIDQRMQFGSSLGYSFINNAYTRLVSTFGAHYSIEHFNLDQDRKGLGWKLSTEFEKSFPTNRMTLSLRNYLTGYLDPTSDVESNLILAMRYPLTHSLTTNVTYEWDFDNRPSFYAKKSDSSLNFGFGYAW